MATKIVIDLNIKWAKGESIVLPDPILPEDPSPPVTNDNVIEFTDQFYKLIKDPLVKEIYLDEGKTYLVNRIYTTALYKRKLKIYSGIKRATILFGVENYTPILHGKQDGELFKMQHDSSLVLENINTCQPKQLRTVETFNPRIFGSIQSGEAKWTVKIENNDTTVFGNNGGFGLSIIYGGIYENHVALINVKHFGTGLIDAKNPYKDAIMYVTMRKVRTYAREDAKLSDTSFKTIGSLKDNVLSFDGSSYSLTAGYNWNWQDNDSYLAHYGRYTFLLDGYKPETVLSDNQFKIRPQAKGLVNVGILNSKTIYSNTIEMHAGDSFDYKGITYTIVSKDRLQYEWFDARTTQSRAVPDRSRAIGYTLDKEIPLTETYQNFGKNWTVKRGSTIVRDNFNEVVDYYVLLNRVIGTIDREQIFTKAIAESYLGYDQISIDYKGEQIVFTDKDITLIYKANANFATTINTKYLESSMLNSRGIGQLSYSHSDISMDCEDVEHLGFYRGSEKGNGISLIWNLSNCIGFEDSGAYFITALPVTKIPNLPLHERIQNI